MRVHKSDERLYKLWKESERRHLDYQILSSELFLVDSFSRPGHQHRVTVSGEELECSCEASWSGLPCTHIAWLAFSIREDEEQMTKNFKKLARIRTRESKKTEKILAVLVRASRGKGETGVQV